jgi:hypothetical protein
MSENDIILSAKNYLRGLSLYGGKFIATQATIEKCRPHMINLARNKTYRKYVLSIFFAAK